MSVIIWVFVFEFSFIVLILGVGCAAIWYTSMKALFLLLSALADIAYNTHVTARVALYNSKNGIKGGASVQSVPSTPSANKNNPVVKSQPYNIDALLEKSVIVDADS